MAPAWPLITSKGFLFSEFPPKTTRPQDARQSHSSDSVLQAPPPPPPAASLLMLHSCMETANWSLSYLLFFFSLTHVYFFKLERNIYVLRRARKPTEVYEVEWSSPSLFVVVNRWKQFDVNFPDRFYIQGWAKVGLQLWVHKTQSLFLYYYVLIIILFELQL